MSFSKNKIILYCLVLIALLGASVIYLLNKEPQVIVQNTPGPQREIALSVKTTTYTVDFIVNSNQEVYEFIVFNYNNGGARTYKLSEPIKIPEMRIFRENYTVFIGGDGLIHKSLPEVDIAMDVVKLRHIGETITLKSLFHDKI